MTRSHHPYRVVASFFLGQYASVMTDNSLLTEVERVLRERGKQENKPDALLPSTAAAPAQPERIDQLVLPDEERGRMPLTKDAYLIRENPQLIAWERELRKFLRNLSPAHGHRVSAVMVYEWATGLKVTELMAEEAELKAQGRQPQRERTWRADLRKLNQLLGEYFGKAFMTYIAGRKVTRCYRVPPGYYIYYHRPKTLTLWAEWREGTKL